MSIPHYFDVDTDVTSAECEIENIHQIFPTFFSQRVTSPGETEGTPTNSAQLSFEAIRRFAVPVKLTHITQLHVLLTLFKSLPT